MHSTATEIGRYRFRFFQTTGPLAAGCSSPAWRHDHPRFLVIRWQRLKRYRPLFTPLKTLC